MENSRELRIINEGGLIPIMENEHGDKFVDARELHEFLGISTRFNMWISRRLDSQEFIENQHFIKAHSFVQVGNLRRPQTDYILTIRTAKKLCMLEKSSEKAMMIREYFLEVEEKLKEVMVKEQFKLPQNYKEALIALVQAEEEKEALQAEIIEQEERLSLVEPKAEVYDVLVDEGTGGILNLTNTAKAIGIGVQDMNKILKKEGVLTSRDKNANYPMQKYVNEGWFVLKTGFTEKYNPLYGKKLPVAYSQTLVTSKGKVKIYELLKRLGKVQ